LTDWLCISGSAVPVLLVFFYFRQNIFNQLGLAGGYFRKPFWRGRFLFLGDHCPPFLIVEPPPREGIVQCGEWLGGLLKSYYRQAV